VIRLLGSELLRFRSRRLVLVLFLVALVVAAFAALIAAVQSTPPGAPALAEARARAAQEYENCLTTDWEDPDIEANLEEFCRQNFGNPSLYAPSHLALADLPSILEGTASITGSIGLVLGASLMAVSWQTGTISTILTWEPRRVRWYSSRMAVIAFGVFIVVLSIVAFLAANLALAAWLRGSTEGVTGAWWTDVTTTSLRIGVVASIAATIAAGIAAVGQRAAAALGAVFVWTVVVEGLVRAFRPLWTPWLLGDNLVSFVGWQTNSESFDAGSVELSPGRAALVIIGYSAIAFLLGLAFVRSRDVQ